MWNKNLIFIDIFARLIGLYECFFPIQIYYTTEKNDVFWMDKNNRIFSRLIIDFSRSIRLKFKCKYLSFSNFSKFQLGNHASNLLILKRNSIKIRSNFFISLKLVLFCLNSLWLWYSIIKIQFLWFRKEWPRVCSSFELQRDHVNRLF